VSTPSPQEKQSRPGRLAAHALIRAYQLSLSSIAGRHCRYLPTCSAYLDEAITRYGFWAGGWMGFARLCRCQPWGAAGFDPVPPALPEQADWTRPWRYGRWRGPLTCEPCDFNAKSPNTPDL
jgi:uncharacterized protein